MVVTMIHIDPPRSQSKRCVKVWGRYEYLGLDLILLELNDNLLNHLKRFCFFIYKILKEFNGDLCR